MSKKLNCFIISSIGEPGSETRKNADDLLELIIKPALEKYNFEVFRGDHRTEPNKIDSDVIKSVQDADLCICDVSLPNMNVFYELGRRDETGKPIILIKSRQSESLPVDIATRRYIEYDLDSRHGIIDAKKQIREFIDPMVEKGFDELGRAATLSEISNVLLRVERKLDRISKKENESNGGNKEKGGGNRLGREDAREIFLKALMDRDIPKAEYAMELLRYQYDKMDFLDMFVEQVAAMGSVKAGEMLIENAQEFADSDMSFKKKMEYLGCLVTFLNRRNIEKEHHSLIEDITRQFEEQMKDEDPDDQIQIYNQRNRLYFGIYQDTGEIEWLKAAIAELKTAYRILPKAFICYNLALCLTKVSDYETARYYIDECMDRSKDKVDVDHLELACEIYFITEDPRYDDMIERLTQISEVKAMFLKMRLNKEL